MTSIRPSFVNHRGPMELNEKNSSVTNQTGTSSLARAEATPTIVREETDSVTPRTPVARKDRIFSLDLIRGVALLGILLVNGQKLPHWPFWEKRLSPRPSLRCRRISPSSFS
jgi:hypothetical protein